MELQDDVGRERHLGAGLVDQPQGVPVAGDLLLRPVVRPRIPQHQPFDPPLRRLDALEAVRRIGVSDEEMRYWSR